LGLVSCGANTPPVTDPVVQKQIQATQILQRVEEFQDLVIDLYANQGISPSHALVYTQFTTSTAKTLRVLPTGWAATVKTAWQEVKTKVPLDQMEVKLQITAKLVDALVNAL
jgi:hypothetical protein